MGAWIHGARRRPAGLLGAQRLPHVRRPLQRAALLGQLSAVVFDVGETLVDETSSWHAWADRAGIGRDRLVATLTQQVAHGVDHRDVLRSFGLDPADPPDWALSTTDLYADAVPCIERLAELGLVVGVVGNQPEASVVFIDHLDLPLALIGSSERWGVTKPDPAFFIRIADELWLRPDRIAYVGDRLDNDVLPALGIGMAAALIRRGPWGTAHARRPEAAGVTVIESLDELPEALG